MDKVQNPSNSECYTPSSEPLRIYVIMTGEQGGILKQVTIVYSRRCLKSTLYWVVTPCISVEGLRNVGIATQIS
jgi:hypothetical protein